MEHDSARQYAYENHLLYIHKARVLMVTTCLPPGDVILDLGGANCPLFRMGYPHDFKKLYLIDLPPDQRCDMYKEIKVDHADCKGEVVIKFNDMTELDEFEDGSVDFVWSGQSIEHVPVEAGRRMCAAAYRVLRKGGAFCLDTPNRLITEIHTRDVGGGYIHPEHHIEYIPSDLEGLLVEAGFHVARKLGVRDMPKTAASNTFFYEDFVAGAEITENINGSYIQFFHCIK